MIGCIIHLPDGGRQVEPDSLQQVITRTVRCVMWGLVLSSNLLNFSIPQAVHKHKGIPVVEVQEEVKPEPLPKSFIAFMKNGELQHKAFS